MPLFTLYCPHDGCDKEDEILVKNVEEADGTTINCPDHPDVEMVRKGAELVSFKNAFIPGGVTNNGTVVPGHFGKEAPLKRGRKRVM